MCGFDLKRRQKPWLRLDSRTEEEQDGETPEEHAGEGRGGEVVFSYVLTAVNYHLCVLVQFP